MVHFYSDMFRRFVLPVILGIILLIIPGILFYLVKTGDAGEKENTDTVSVREDAESVHPVTKLWDDQAGFTFRYPENLRINPHEEDMENYAHIEITDPEHSGNLIIWAKDASYSSLDEWIEDDPALNAGTSVDTTLGDQPAKKIAVQTPEKMLITGTFFDGMLVILEARSAEGKYWQQIHQSISEDFTFKPIPMENGEIDDNPDAGTGITEEIMEEEIVE